MIDTVSFVSHFFPLLCPLYPLAPAPFIWLLPAHPPAFSVILGIAIFAFNILHPATVSLRQEEGEGAG